jgi:prolipoprotein diacylglyceryl transferase
VSVLAAIPSPDPSWMSFGIGPLTIHTYALCIIAGIVAATAIAERRWIARGGLPGQVLDVIVWAVPFGIVGARIYHVVSSPEAYFGAGGDPVRALYIWEGGLGIWGAVALGALGAWIGCRRHGIRLAPFADAVAPGLIVAQAIGRLGNWFNQELFGRPTDLPWGLRIDEAYRPSGFASSETFHPTFLYELLWCLASAAVLVLWDRRTRQGHGRVFWGYVVLYTLGRVWIEALRIDPAEDVLGLRLNIWTSLAVCAVGLIGLTVARRGRETEVLTRRPADATADGGSGEEAVEQLATGTDHREEAQEAARRTGHQEDPPAHP